MAMVVVAGKEGSGSAGGGGDCKGRSSSGGEDRIETGAVGMARTLNAARKGRGR